MYAAIGLAGRALFPKPWQGALAAGTLVLLISLAGARWSAAKRKDTNRKHAASER